MSSDGGPVKAVPAGPQERGQRKGKVVDGVEAGVLKLESGICVVL